MKNIHIFIYRPVCPHTQTRAHTCACSPSELLTFSSRLIAIDICLLSGACSRVGADGNGWCCCWRRKRREGKTDWSGVGVGGCRAVWGWMKGGVWGIGKLPTRPLESIWTPLPAERSQAAWALYPPYKGAIALTRESSAAIWLHCPVIPPVIYQKRPWSSCRIRAVSCSPVIDAGIKLCIKWAVAGGAPSLSLKTVDGMEGCSWFSAALTKGKAGCLLLYRGSLLVAERGTARWRRNTCAFKNSKHVI